MRRAVFVALFALMACSPKGEFRVCESTWHGESCRHFESAEEASEATGREAEAERAKSIKTAKSLPFDYAACSGQVLAMELREGQHSPDDAVYVSVFEADPGRASLEMLSALRPNTHPRSSTPTQGDGLSPAPGWRYNLFEMRARSLHRGYEAYVSYYCGALCAGSYRYRLEKDGNSCKVVSREQFGPVS